MPDYVYRCGAGHRLEMSHRMLYGTAVLCPCGGSMRRVPQVPRINWNGLPPSGGTLHPAMKGLIADAPRRRAEENNEHE